MDYIRVLQPTRQQTLQHPPIPQNNRSPPQSPNGSTDVVVCQTVCNRLKRTVESGQLSLLFNCETSKKLRLQWKVTNSSTVSKLDSCSYLNCIYVQLLFPAGKYECIHESRLVMVYFKIKYVIMTS